MSAPTGETEAVAVHLCINGTAEQRLAHDAFDDWVSAGNIPEPDNPLAVVAARVCHQCVLFEVCREDAVRRWPRGIRTKAFSEVDADSVLGGMLTMVKNDDRYALEIPLDDKKDEVKPVNLTNREPIVLTGSKRSDELGEGPDELYRWMVADLGVGIGVRGMRAVARIGRQGASASKNNYDFHSLLLPALRRWADADNLELIASGNSRARVYYLQPKQQAGAKAVLLDRAPSSDTVYPVVTDAIADIDGSADHIDAVPDTLLEADDQLTAVGEGISLTEPPINDEKSNKVEPQSTESGVDPSKDNGADEPSKEADESVPGRWAEGLSKQDVGLIKHAAKTAEAYFASRIRDLGSIDLLGATSPVNSLAVHALILRNDSQITLRTLIDTLQIETRVRMTDAAFEKLVVGELQILLATHNPRSGTGLSRRIVVRMDHNQRDELSKMRLSWLRY